MVELIAESIGLAAGTLATLSFAPQAIQTYRTKSAKDFSWLMLLSFFSATILWLIYGILINSFAIVITDAVTSILLVALVWMKFSYERKRK